MHLTLKLAIGSVLVGCLVLALKTLAWWITGSVALLSDALRGAPGLRTPWPTDDPGIGRDERMELQRLLAARGHDIGAIDGAIGERSREAIRKEQVRLGWTVDGRAGRKLLQALREGL